MNDNVLLRDVEVDDSVRLAELADQLGYPCTNENIKERIKSYIKQNTRRIIVAEINGAVVGWTSLDLVEHFYVDSYVQISGLIVDKAYRGRGIGKKIIDEAKRWTKEKGCACLRLQANVIRKEAHRFYKREGFSILKQQYVFAVELVN
jgi:ribosomal protein S18 acetylase RimI-like enzyme